MCRSIKRLREETVVVGPEEIRQAALQYVRKVTGFGRPSPANLEIFEQAIEEITSSTMRLMSNITIAGKPTSPA